MAVTANREQIEVTNPITDEIISTVNVDTDDDVRSAVERARSAQPAWAAMSVKERARILHRWGDMLWDDQKNAMDIIRRENGKAESGALLEILVLDSVIQYYYRNALKILKPKKRPALLPFVERASIHYKPHGVVGLISPWNFPLLLPVIDAAPALFAGNAVVLKPSEISPDSAQYAVEMMHKAGVPKDVAQVVHGDGRTGAALVEYVDYIAFTGSTAIGRKVASRAGERLIPFSVELGGKDPAIVLKDANLDMAVTGLLRGAFENAGQVCQSVERAYVEDAIYNEFVDKVRHYTAQMKVGAEAGLDVHMGSMTNECELARTEAHIKDAVEKGAEILYGGKRLPDLGPLFFEPTVLVNVDHSMAVMRDETFGPILPIMKVKDAEEAIRLANDNGYGLAASIFTSDLKRGEKLALHIDTGDVSVNRTQMVFGTPSLPSGGQKNSGIGRRNGPEGLLRYVSVQSVVLDNLFAQKPDLRIVDPLTLKTVLILRKLRRWLPFL